MFTERAMIVSSGFPYGVTGFLFFSIIVSCFKINSGRALNDFIRHFEPVFFNQHHMRDHHRRSIRSTVERHINLQFFAYGRMFRLRLERDPWVFADRAQFESSGSDAVHYDTTRVLTGHAEGEENSLVQGVLLSSGLFDGTIRIGDEELYVEPAQNYFQTPPDFHSVIYRLSDVHFPVINRTCVSVPLPPKFRHRLKTTSGRRRARTKEQDERFHRESSQKNSTLPSNSIRGDFPKWLKTSRARHLDGRWHSGSSGVPGSGNSPRETFETFRSDMEDVLEDHPLYWRDLDSLHYTADSGGSSSSEPYGVRSVQRTQWPEEGGSRRGSVAVDRRKSTCLLYLQADHLFYRRLGGEEACIDAMTRHVQRVNSIYRNTELT